MSTRQGKSGGPFGRRCAVVLGTLAASVAITGAFASVAFGAQAIESFSVSTSSTQAGDHPDLGMSFSLESPGQPEAARNVTVNTPEGLFGNPNAIIRCTAVDFALTRCPSGSQAGLITVRANYEGEPNKLLGTAPIYDIEANAEEAGLFAFIVPTLNIPVSIPVKIRTAGDFGLRFRVAEITQLTPLAAADIMFWGFPADHSHDANRFPKGSPGSPAGCPGVSNTSCLTGPTTAAITPQPLINSPSQCTGEQLPVAIEVETYQDSEDTSTATSNYPAVTDCYRMVFNPFLTAIPTTDAADSPSGLDLVMRAPQPFGKATTPSPISSAILTFPDGFTINPDAADGQSMCTDEEVRFGTEGAARCPGRAKIGTFTVDSLALDDPLIGAIYIGEPKPENQYRLILTADGFGIHVKFLGSFRPDPQTGRLSAFIEDLPQVPFEDFQLHLFSSDRGLMATPTQCRVYAVSARFFPWNDKLADQAATQPFAITRGPNGTPCPGLKRNFQPRLSAGTSKPVAGAYSDFALKLDRDDGDQFLQDLTFRMPPGFTGDLRGIPYCPEVSISAAAQRSGHMEQLAPSCPAASQIGTSNVSAGPGTHPFHAAGRMYLSGPFKGAPLSLVAVTPALAGPYDYGVVVVRVALHVNEATAQVFAVSDTVPQIIGGIPIRMRSIRVSIDRPNFTINPTNCSNFTVDSQGIGDQGTIAAFSSPFTAVNCKTLPFRPKMRIRQLGGRGQTKRTKNPRLRFDLITRAGDANVKRVAVTLPKAFAIDQRHLGNICSKAQLERERCAGRQRIGFATVWTPLLDAPLQGPAYAVSGFGKLPRVAFILGGQVTLVPQAESKSVQNGHLKTTVPIVPDAPIGHFRLTLLGKSKGYLVNTRDLCASKAVTTVRYAAHSGRRLTQRVRVKVPCGKRRNAKRARHSRR